MGHMVQMLLSLAMQYRCLLLKKCFGLCSCLFVGARTVSLSKKKSLSFGIRCYCQDARIVAVAQ